MRNEPTGLVLFSAHRSWIDLRRSCDVPGTVKENIWLMPRLWLHTLIKNIVNKLVLLNHCVTTRHVGNDPTFLPKYWWDVSSRYICSNMG